LPCGSGFLPHHAECSRDTLDGITPKLINEAQSKKPSFI